MSDTGWKSPGTVVDDSSVGEYSWSNPSNAKASDDNYATAYSDPSAGDSHYLKATNFGFSIPSGSTIDGILVRIERRCPQTKDVIYDKYVKIIKSNGSIGSTNKALATSWGTTDSYFEYGSSSDKWGETWTYLDINDTDFGVALSVSMDSGVDAYVDHIQIKVYYTESSGTEVNSERGLYIKGYGESSSERGLYTQGYLTNSSERGLYIEGFISDLYSRESASDLESNDTALATTFSEQDYTDVESDDNVYVDLQGTARYMKFLFREFNENESGTQKFTITWKGKSSVAPSTSPVYLQVYNRTLEQWETLASNNVSSANTKFTLTGTQSTNLGDYYDSNYVISIRTYQEII